MFLIILSLFIFNILILIFFNPLAKFVNIYDYPSDRKIHKIKTPIIGGLIILLNLFFLNILIELNFIENFRIENIFENKFKYYIFLISTLVIFLIGFIDDKIEISPILKLLFLSILIFGILYIDNSILIREISFSFTNKSVHLGKYSFLFTTLCFLLFINACNMFDGINLQSCSYYLLILFFLLSFDLSNLIITTLIISVVTISILNLKGKVFMGDSGVYLCSFVIGYLIIKYYNINLIRSSDTIFILMMVPGIDMFRLFIVRILSKKNPFYPDKLHLHHLLLGKFNYLKTILILILLLLFPILFLILNFSNILIIAVYIVLYLYFILKFKNIKKNTLT